jgi:hypothetical protein
MPVQGHLHIEHNAKEFDVIGLCGGERTSAGLIPGRYKFTGKCKERVQQIIIIRFTRKDAEYWRDQHYFYYAMFTPDPHKPLPNIFTSNPSVEALSKLEPQVITDTFVNHIAMALNQADMYIFIKHGVLKGQLSFRQSPLECSPAGPNGTPLPKEQHEIPTRESFMRSAIRIKRFSHDDIEDVGIVFQKMANAEFQRLIDVRQAERSPLRFLE